MKENFRDSGSFRNAFLERAIIRMQKPSMKGYRYPFDPIQVVYSKNFIRTTLKLSQGNVCARMVSELTFYIKKFTHKIITKDLIWKYSETATPWVFDETWWNLASQVRPNVPSTNLSGIPPTFVWIVNFVYSLCMWMEWLWNKVIWTSIQ